MKCTARCALLKDLFQNICIIYLNIIHNTKTYTVRLQIMYEHDKTPYV